MFFSHIYAIEVLLPDSCQFVYQSMLWATEPRESFMYINYQYEDIHILMCDHLCATIFLSKCQTKRLQKGYRKENKTSRLVLIRFQSMLLLNNYRTVARNLGI